MVIEQSIINYIWFFTQLPMFFKASVDSQPLLVAFGDKGIFSPSYDIDSASLKAAV